MRVPPVIATTALVGLSAIPTVVAWGAAGHEIVATLAEVYLHPVARSAVCEILGRDPSTSDCHLANIATWADKVRMLPGFRWSAGYHYIGAKDDNPSQTCSYPGSLSWAGREGANVLGGLRNVTTILESYAYANGAAAGPDPLAEEALKFLVHFVGDMHMPLHLTGRARGGNGIKVRFDGRLTNLHSVWDSRLIAKTLRTLPYNYTVPLPGYPQLEHVLKGTIYDPYIRRVFWEGLRPDAGTWSSDVPSWLVCPEPPQDSATDSTGWPAHAQHMLGMLPTPKDPRVEFDDATVCPYHWSAEIHPLNCELIWPPALDDPEFAHAFTDEDGAHSSCAHDHDGAEDDDEDEGIKLSARAGRPPIPSKYLELDTPAYAGVIGQRRVIEKLMAMGGIRLAAVLNYLFVAPEELNASGLWVAQV